MKDKLLVDSVKPLDESRFSLTSDQKLQIHGSVCTACSVRSHPSRDFCPQCSERMVFDFTQAPEGVIEAFTVVHQEVPGRLIASPYLLAEVQLTNGLRLRCISTVTLEVGIGSRVKLDTQQFETDDGPRLGLVFSLS